MRKNWPHNADRLEDEKPREAQEVNALLKRLLADGRTQQMYCVTGEVDYILTVIVHDMQDYDDYSKTLAPASAAVLRFQSNVVIEGLRIGLEIAI